MSFETSEIESIIKKLNDEKSEIERLINSILSSTTQLQLLGNDINDIMSETQIAINEDQNRESVLIDALNKISVAVTNRPTILFKNELYLRGKHDQIDSSIKTLTDTVKKIAVRNENQEKLIQKLKSGDIPMKGHGPEDVQDRKSGERPEGIANLRRARGKMKKDEDGLIFKESDELDTI
tara:strand:- start:7968 stop:8507 length:540 start_codon:yes stop_codon:yes gene_type:complete